MIDTGSQTNLIKLSCLKENTVIDRNNTINLYGLSNTLIKSIGSTDLEIYDRVEPFYIIDSDFHLPYDGILGLPFLIDNKAIINFSSAEISIKDKTYRFNKPRNFGMIEKYLATINIYSDKRNIHNLKYINFSNIFDTKGQFLVDSGAEISIISENFIPENFIIDKNDTIFLRGIDGELITTLGLTTAIYFKKNLNFT